MRHYEIVFLVHPDQSEQVPAMIDRYKEMVNSGQGQVHRVEDWGRRRLAYTINDVHKAHYIMVNIECDLPVLNEIEKNFKFNDSVLRYLVVRRKTAFTEESAMAKAKAKEDADEAEKMKRTKYVDKTVSKEIVIDEKVDVTAEESKTVDDESVDEKVDVPAEESKAVKDESVDEKVDVPAEESKAVKDESVDEEVNS